MGFPTTTPLLPLNVTAPQVAWGSQEADPTRGVERVVITSSLITGSYRDGVAGQTLVTIPLADVPINGYHAHYPRSDTHSPLVDTTIAEATFTLYDGLGRPLANRGQPWSVDLAIDVIPG